MVQIIDGRGTGKTSRLLLLAKENNYIIACHNPEVLRDKSYNYGITGLEIISYKELLKGCYGKSNPDKILIDELEMFTKYVVSQWHRELVGYTLSKE